MSDKSLDKLIETLKREAIEAAQNEAAAILDEARKKADGMVKEAREKRAQILEAAQSEATQTKEKGEGALRQAARDVTVSLQNDLMALLGNVLENDVRAQFGPEVVREAIGRILENVGSGVELRLSKDLMEGLGEHVRAKLQSSDQLLTQEGPDTLPGSIVLTKKDEGWSYHISPEAVSELLRAQLSGRWLEILNKKP